MKTVRIGASLGALACLLAAAPAVGADIPKGNHYVCYPVKVEAFKAREASFVDQFGRSTVTLVRPVLMCAPAEKHLDGKTTGTIDSALHMVCYEVKYNGKTPPKVKTTDQLGSLTLTASPATTVCLPASKTLLKQ